MFYRSRTRFYDPLTGSFTQPDSLVPDAMDPRAWNRFGYVYGNPANFTDPSGHCIWDGCLFEIAATGFIIGSLTNLTANAITSDDPWGYLTSQEAGADLLIGGTFSAAAALLTPEVVTLGAATKVSTSVLLRQAVGFGALSVAQGETTALARYWLSGQEPSQTFGERAISNFLYGFSSLYVAQGGSYLAGKVGTLAFNRLTHSRFPGVKNFTQGAYNAIRSYRQFKVMDPLHQRHWEKQVGEFITSSSATELGMITYGYGWFIGNSYQ